MCSFFSLASINDAGWAVAWVEHQYVGGVYLFIKPQLDFTPEFNTAI